MLLYTCFDKTTLKGLTVVTILCKLSSEIDYVCATSDLSRTIRFVIEALLVPSEKETTPIRTRER